MKHLFQHIKSELAPLYSPSEISELYCILLQDITLQPRTDILLGKNAKLSNLLEKQFFDAVEKLKNNIPVQYVTGKTEFMEFEFEVNPSVLIPRPETEELVEWIITENHNRQKISILDIGTGSGCIAVSLKKILPQAEVYALDISEDALIIAKKNAAKNNVKIAFSQTDILQNPEFAVKFDIIASNPPYIAESEESGISTSVLDFEPHLALFVPNDNPLIFYEKIMFFAKKYLNINGKIYIEINRSKGQQIAALAEKCGFSNIELRKDISGNERMVKLIL